MAEAPLDPAWPRSEASREAQDGATCYATSYYVTRTYEVHQADPLSGSFPPQSSSIIIQLQNTCTAPPMPLTRLPSCIRAFSSNQSEDMQRASPCTS